VVATAVAWGAFGLVIGAILINRFAERITTSDGGGGDLVRSTPPNAILVGRRAAPRTAVAAACDLPAS
jgi:hypothetical protein